MPLYITDAEARSLVSVDDAYGIIEGLFRDEASGLTEQTPTTELHIPNSMFRMKVGGAYGSGFYGFKAYLGNAGYRVFVYSLDSGFEGLVEAYDLTEIRTGAVSAVATQYMAREDARDAGHPWDRDARRGRSYGLSAACASCVASRHGAVRRRTGRRTRRRCRRS